jgi:hypothetical protein
MKRTASRIVVLTILFSVAVTGHSLGRAEQTTTTPDVLGSLLIEVRGLRATMERMASTDAHVQLVLGRLQLQEQRIVNQVRRLDSVKASLIVAQRKLDVLAQRVKEEAEGVKLFDDPDVRRGREAQLLAAKLEWSRKNAEVQRLIAEDASLTQDIGAEQSRWTDFNQRLEDLERALAPR